MRGFDEAFEVPDPRGVAHFSERFGFDLANPLAGDFKLFPHLFERAAVAIDEAKPLLENFALARGEGIEDVPYFYP